MVLVDTASQTWLGDRVSGADMFWRGERVVRDGEAAWSATGKGSRL